MKTISFAIIFIMLPVLMLHASLMKVTVDAVNPPEGFSTMFSLTISYENNLCIITLSYDSALKEKITEKLPGGSFLEYSTGNGIQSCHLLFYNNQNTLILTAPVCFTEKSNGRTSTTITIQKDLLQLLRIQIYMPVMIESFCYELHFMNVNPR
jgi:hypothetical protein